MTAAERPDAGEGLTPGGNPICPVCGNWHLLGHYCAPGERLTEERCDHRGECKPEQRECQWVHFRRVYIECDCGGWDQFWRSRSGAEFLAGRKNHRRDCPNNLAARETAAVEAVVGRVEALASEMRRIAGSHNSSSGLCDWLDSQVAALRAGED